ncbi:MAG TPA: phytanoyl-CoA dioxygenase family protein [Streptosporangiaceae bacterium]|nr:phytanoyl-CoA dioxygenase family protein [Streptosporangiaceae bacterium]
MRGHVTDEEIRRYRRDGFAVLRDVLSPGETAFWRGTLTGALERRQGRLPGDPGQYGEFFRTEHEYYNKVFTQKINLWKTDQAVRPLVLSEDLGRMAAQLSGSSGVRVYLDQALVKEPYANPTAFHIDVPFWSFTSADALTIWLALDDATVQNGCLCYIPGSHREQRFDNADIGPELGALFGVYPQWKDIDPVFCPVPAGSAVVHNGLTAHGAGANMTPRRRFAMTIAYMPDGSVFNGKQDIYTSEQAARMKPGDVLDDPALNPLVYPPAPAA